VVSLDLIISVVLLMLFIGIMIIFFPQEADAAQEYRHGSQLLTDLENLRFTDSDVAFYANYRIDNDRLATFADRDYSTNPPQETDQKHILMGTSDYYAFNNDVCLFFLDSTGVRPIRYGMDAIGLTFNTEERTSRQPCETGNPCSYYSRAHSFSRPVLRDGRIVTMYIVICEA
jgi:hypothetical protein